MSLCRTKGCERTARANGDCWPCYQWGRRHPGETRVIEPKKPQAFAAFTVKVPKEVSDWLAQSDPDGLRARRAREILCAVARRPEVFAMQSGFLSISAAEDEK